MGNAVGAADAGCGALPICASAPVAEAHGAKVLFADEYSLGKKLGSGTFGEVWECEGRRELQKDFSLAVKIVDQYQASLVSAALFHAAKTELAIMRTLQHPHIVDVMEVFEEDRYLYVVMERIPGGELFEVVAQPGAVMLEEDVSSIALALMQALEYLHSNGIVHRDVKGQNILLKEPPRLPGRVLENADIKLIDFGLAAKLQVHCLMGAEPLALVCGTPAMCSPELWATQASAPAKWKSLYGETYGPKVDVWAAGVVLCLALLGHLPFFDTTPARLAAKVCDPALEADLVCRGQGQGSAFSISPSCEHCLRDMLAKHPENRPTAAKAARDAWLAGDSRSRSVNVMEVPDGVRASAAAQAREVAKARVPFGGYGKEDMAEAACSTDEEESSDDDSSDTSSRSGLPLC